MDLQDHFRRAADTIVVGAGEGWTWTRRNPRTVLIGTLLTASCVLALILVVHTSSKRSSSGSVNSAADGLLSSSSSGDRCLTRDCVTFANNILEYGRPEVRPCENFYQFACGNYKRFHRFSEGVHFMSTALEMKHETKRKLHKLLTAEGYPGREVVPDFARKIRTYYKSCMDLVLMERVGNVPILRFIHNLGGWPILEGYWDLSKKNDSQYDWERSLEILMKAGGLGPSTPLFQTQWIKSHRERKYNVRVSRPGKMMRFQKEFLRIGGSLSSNTSVTSRQLREYERIILESALELNGAQELSVEDVSRILKLEARISDAAYPSSISSMPIQRRRHRYGKLSESSYSILELDALLPSLKLGSILRSMFELTSADESIMMEDMDFFFVLDKIMESTSARDLQNFLVFHGILFVAQDGSKFWRSIDERWKAVVLGRPGEDLEDDDSERVEVCLEEVKDFLGLGLSRMFLDGHYDEDVSREVNIFWGHMRAELEHMIGSIHWMDAETRRRAVAKFQAMRTVLGEPPANITVDWLENYYTDIHFRADNFFENRLALRKWSYENAHITHKTTVDFDETIEKLWKFVYEDLHESRMGYSNTYNILFLPAGAVHHVYFSHQRPHYLNFGSVGTRLGSLVAKGYSEQGQLFDEKGEATQWWSERTIQLEANRTDCLGEQMRGMNYTHSHTTRTEKKTDTGSYFEADYYLQTFDTLNFGLRAAYGAYRRYLAASGREPLLPAVSYDDEQLFFIAFAQVNCRVHNSEDAIVQKVLRERRSYSENMVLNTLRNLPEFSRAFRCPPDSPMNPTDKCILW